jgi:hypothetical protein
MAFMRKLKVDKLLDLLSSHVLSENVKIKIYKTILYVLFCMGVNLGLTIREEHRLKVFQNRVLRRIFGPKTDEVTGGWRKLYEFHNLYRQSLLLERFHKVSRCFL